MSVEEDRAAYRAKVLKEAPHLKDFLPFLDSDRAESPRGSVLLTAAFIEEQLKDILLSFLVEPSGKALLSSGINAPLGTFSAKLMAAHALGLITDGELREIQILKKNPQ